MVEAFSLIHLFSLFCVGGWLMMLVRAVLLHNWIPKLAAAPSPQTFPLVSVIVPAKNESKKIHQSLRSLLLQDYPNLEIIVINDRSDDETGDIINRLAKEDARLKPIHIAELPHGWLGKNHANQRGFEQASGEYLLFTDADILFAPETVSKTVGYAQKHKARHIVVYPKMLSENIFEESFLALFGMLFVWKFNPIGARNPKNKRAYIGVGAFNFIERALYKAIGEHVPLKAEIADDVKLGYFVKQQNEATHVVEGRNFVQVRWREGLWDSIKGIERSAFAGVNFSWAWIWIGVFGTLFGLIAPYWLWLLNDKFATLCALLSLGFIYLGYAVGKGSLWRALFVTMLHPVMSVLFLYALVKSALLVSVKGGVEWRGTFYATEVLKP
ncbi:MAG: glycosyltransferase family 2 protein [Chloroherpetonaceae bacterium]